MQIFVVDSRKICTLQSSLTIWKNNSIIAQLYDSADNVWNITEEVPTSVEVLGPAKWLLLVDVKERRRGVLLDKHQCDIEPLNLILMKGFISVKRLGLKARDRPVGLGSRHSVPDHSFVGNNTYIKNVPHNGRLYAAFYYVYPGGWLQIDLEHLHRLYVVAMMGNIWQSTIYVTRSFQIKYSTESSSSLTTYSEKGHSVSFPGSDESSWYLVQKRKFKNPFIARYIRFIPLEGSNQLPISLEYYGVRLFEDDGVYKQENIFQLIPELFDNDYSTSVLVGQSAKFILSFSHTVSSKSVGIYITVNTESCAHSEVVVLAYVHRFADIFTFDGVLYDECKPIDVITESDLFITYQFDCFCEYGLCEHALFILNLQQKSDCLKVSEIQHF